MAGIVEIGWREVKADGITMNLIGKLQWATPWRVFGEC